MKILNERNAVIAIIVGAVVFAAIPFFFLWNESANFDLTQTVNHDKLSSYGSLMSGLIGTIWSLAGVVLFYVALREQRDDMRVNKENLRIQTEALTLQVKEFEHQTKELEETRKVYIEQSKTQTLQRFESTFFQMIALHHNLITGMVIRNSHPTPNREGRDCFKSLVNLLDSRFRDIPGNNTVIIIRAYTDIYTKYQEILGHYFRNLYHIYKFIERSDVSDKMFYAGLIRAQLSTMELELLFYNGLSINGRDKFKPLIESYSVLKNLNKQDIHGGLEMLKNYSSNAFGQDYKFEE